MISPLVGLLQKNKYELARNVGEKIDTLKKMKSGIVQLLLLNSKYSDIEYIYALYSPSPPDFSVYSHVD